MELGRAWQTWSPRERALVVVLVACAALVFLAFHASLFFEAWGDERVHLYVTHRMSMGAVLYKDIHSARPPLALWPLKWLQDAALGPLEAGRLLVILTMLVTAGVLAELGTRMFSPAVGVLAAVLFLVSPDAAYWFEFSGIQQVALGVLLTAGLSWLDRPALAGVAGGLALASGQHAVAVVVVCALRWVRRPRELLTFTASAGAVLGIILLVAILQSGGGAWEDLVGQHLYHLRTEGKSSGPGWLFTAWGWDNAFLFAAALAALVLAHVRPKGKKHAAAAPDLRRPVRWLAGLVAVHLAVVLLMRGPLLMYTFPVYPLLVLLACAGFHHAWRRSRRTALLGVALAATLGWSQATATVRAQGRKDAAWLPYARYWQDVVGQDLRTMEKLFHWAGSITKPDETLFGHATIVDLVALKAGRRVSAELADLSPRWFKLGQVSREEVITAVEADHVGAVVTPPWFFAKDATFAAYLQRCYYPPETFSAPPQGPGSALPPILVYRHREPRPCR